MGKIWEKAPMSHKAKTSSLKITYSLFIFKNSNRVFDSYGPFGPSKSQIFGILSGCVPRGKKASTLTKAAAAFFPKTLPRPWECGGRLAASFTITDARE